jgi:hypothetical protein
MILRPVSPASPCGPPITKRPVGFTWMTVFSTSNSPAGSDGVITCSMIAWRISSGVASGSCWVETTTVSTCTGRSPSYSTETCVFPSGRSQATSPLLRTAASRSAMRWASRMGVGISASFSSVA